MKAGSAVPVLHRQAVVAGKGRQEGRQVVVSLLVVRKSRKAGRDKGMAGSGGVVYIVGRWQAGSGKSRPAR